MTPLSGCEQAVMYWRERAEEAEEWVRILREENEALKRRRGESLKVRWSATEDARLKQLRRANFCVADIQDILFEEGFPRRSHIAIEHRIAKLQARVTALKFGVLWSEEEDRIIIENWADLSASRICELIKRPVSRSAVLARATRLQRKGLIRPKTHHSSLYLNGPDVAQQERAAA